VIKSCEGPWILSFEETIELANGMSPFLLGCPHLPGIMHEGALEVFFLHLYLVGVT
jgi:hypothetical protein